MSGNTKKRIKYECVKCDFNTCNKTDFGRHINTVKHLGNVQDTKNAEKRIHENPTACQSVNKATPQSVGSISQPAKNAKTLHYECEICGQPYITNSGLWKHKKNCVLPITDKQMMMTLIKQNAELHDKIIELCKTGVTNNTVNTNSHNKTFNLQFFLNETCKNAMNISDFIESVVLQLSDIDNIGEVGYAKGMSNIIISKLNSLGETKRPIHCTDVKREVMYVKDEDKWEKDANKEKMRLLIRKMDKKLTPLMIAFSNNHKKEYHTDAEIINHQKVIYEVLGGIKEDADNEEAIIQQISKAKGLQPTK